MTKKSGLLRTNLVRHPVPWQVPIRVPTLHNLPDEDGGWPEIKLSGIAVGFYTCILFFSAILEQWKLIGGVLLDKVFLCVNEDSLLDRQRGYDTECNFSFEMS